MRDFIEDIYSPRPPVTVISNVRSSELFYSGDKQAHVFTMGRIWDEAKNISLLVKAAPQIKYPIRIAGDNSFDNNGIDISGASIVSLGKLSTKQVADELAIASVFVLPAKYEPFGLSALEAALSGCALVLGDIPSLQEIWEDNALYVDTRDEDALASTINRLMCNERRLTEYANKAFSHAQRYSTAAMAQDYMNIYKRVLHAGKETMKTETV